MNILYFPSFGIYLPSLGTWAIFGLLVWAMMTDDLTTERKMSIGQLVLIRALAGPLVWVYSLYQLLSHVGRRG